MIMLTRLLTAWFKQQQKKAILWITRSNFMMGNLHAPLHKYVLFNSENIKKMKKENILPCQVLKNNLS